MTYAMYGYEIQGKTHIEPTLSFLDIVYKYLDEIEKQYGHVPQSQ